MGQDIPLKNPFRKFGTTLLLGYKSLEKIIS